MTSVNRVSEIAPTCRRRQFQFAKQVGIISEPKGTGINAGRNDRPRLKRNSAPKAGGHAYGPVGTAGAGPRIRPANGYRPYLPTTHRQSEHSSLHESGSEYRRCSCETLKYRGPTSLRTPSPSQSTMPRRTPHKTVSEGAAVLVIALPSHKAKLTPKAVISLTMSSIWSADAPISAVRMSYPSQTAIEE